MKRAVVVTLVGGKAGYFIVGLIILLEAVLTGTTLKKPSCFSKTLIYYVR